MLVLLYDLVSLLEMTENMIDIDGADRPIEWCFLSRKRCTFFHE